jgi:alkylation response protein AidB-like acyl-CoA dehydrogenase
VGRKTLVPFAESAAAMLVTTESGVVLVPAPEGGFRTERLETIDHAQRFSGVAFDAPARPLLDVDAWREMKGRLEGLAAVGAAAFLLGLMQTGFERSVVYLKERVAFGGPIGRFQVLQHRAAEMLIRVENSRAAVYRAAWLHSRSSDEAPLAVAAAKAYAGDSARYVMREAIQIFGGVGFTWEYDLHVYYKRVKTLEQLHGSTREQIERALLARCAR